MTNTLRAAIKALMNKFSIASMVEDLTIVQAIDSNDEQIQDIQAGVPTYVYKAVITQLGTNAPLATVLVNTFPSATFSYIGEGQYSLNLGIDLNDLNVTTIQQSCYNGTDVFNVVGYTDFAGVYYIDNYDSTRTLADDLLSNYTLVIEAYPA